MFGRLLTIESLRKFHRKSLARCAVWNLPFMDSYIICFEELLCRISFASRLVCVSLLWLAAVFLLKISFSEILQFSLSTVVHWNFLLGGLLASIFVLLKELTCYWRGVTDSSLKFNHYRLKRVICNNPHEIFLLTYFQNLAPRFFFIWRVCILHWCTITWSSEISQFTNVNVDAFSILKIAPRLVELVFNRP